MGPYQSLSTTATQRHVVMAALSFTSLLITALLSLSHTYFLHYPAFCTVNLHVSDLQVIALRCLIQSLPTHSHQFLAPPPPSLSLCLSPCPSVLFVAFTHFAPHIGHYFTTEPLPPFRPSPPLRPCHQLGMPRAMQINHHRIV